MSGPAPTTLAGSPAAIGRAHGERFGSSIRAYLEERLRLATDGSWSDGVPREADEVLAIVADMEPAHRRYRADLFAETEALADAAGISVPEALLVSGFTDVVDAFRDGAHVGSEHDCTAVLVPSGRGEGRAFFAQTWDMHASAAPYVTVLRIEPDDAPSAVVFTTTGCLGQIGMNDAGIAIGITNLAAARGTIGVTWPFVVRAVLTQESFDDALACVTSAEVAGGHNYLLLGPGGRGAAVESMPGRHVVEHLTGTPIVRTNHCLVGANVADEAPEPPGERASSERRLAHATTRLTGDGRIDDETLRALFAEPPVRQRVTPPQDVATLGAVIAEPAAGILQIALGAPDAAPFRAWHVTGDEERRDRPSEPSGVRRTRGGELDRQTHHHRRTALEPGPRRPWLGPG